MRTMSERSPENLRRSVAAAQRARANRPPGRIEARIAGTAGARRRRTRGAPLALVPALLLGACFEGGFDDEGTCPEYEPVPATPVGVVDIARVDAFARGPRSLSGGETPFYDAIADDETVAAVDLLLSVVPAVVQSVTDETRPRPTPRLSCFPPPGPSVVTNTRLIDVTLSSDERWNDAYPAGRALDDLASVDATAVLGVGVGELPARLESGRFGLRLSGVSGDTDAWPRLGDYLRDEPPVPFGLRVRLEPPDAERSHRFTVTYRTDDGETFTATSAPVTVAPRRAPSSVDALGGTAWRLRGYTARTADGSSVERTVDSAGVSGLEFSGAPSQMVVSFPGLSSCEFNVRVADGTLELRGADPAEPYDPDVRGCVPDTVEPTDEHRFLERFLGGPSYRLAIDPAASPERLTLTAPNGERLVLDAVL